MSGLSLSLGFGLAAQRSGVTPYLGPVASRTGYFNDTSSATPKQIMVRTVHRATDNITALQIVEAHWRTNAGAETSFAGSTLLVNAEIEYPANTYTPITWSGGAQGSVAASTSGISDMASVVIPQGAYFAVQRYLQCTAGLCFSNMGTRFDIGGFGQDVFNHGASGVTNVVGTNTRATQGGAGTGNMSWPASILGYTTRPTIGLLGDSRARGATTSVTSTLFNSVGESGEIARALGPNFACVNGGVYGSNLAQFSVAAAPLQRAILTRCSHIAIQRGINSVTGGQTAVQVAASEDSIMSQFPGKKFLFTTLAPSGSADNVTPHATNSVRNTVNAARLARASSNIITVDITSIVETGPGTGLWTATYSTDWGHATEVGYAAIEASALWSAVRSAIAYP